MPKNNLSFHGYQDTRDPEQVFRTGSSADNTVVFRGIDQKEPLRYTTSTSWCNPLIGKYLNRKTPAFAGKYIEVGTHES